MGLRDAIKRKMPATFNAAEYETGRVLDRLDKLSSQVRDEEILNRLGDLFGQLPGEEVLERLDSLAKQLNQTTERIEALEQQNRWLIERLSKDREQGIHLKPKPVLRVELHVSETCNLNCRMCSHFSCIAKPEFLEPAVLERDMKRLAELYDNGVYQIKLLGGEPLLNPKLPELCHIVRRHFPDAHLVITTNGTLLPKMGDEFWLACKETRVELLCTEYPISFDYKEVEALVRRRGIPYSRVNDEEMTFHHMPLDLTGGQDPVQSFRDCDHKNYACVSLYHGRLYTCTVAMNARHFEKRFHAGITLSPRDSIDIYEASSAWEIAEFLSRPIPFCRFCDVGRRTWGHKWGKTKHSIQEWTLPSPEDDT